MDTSAFVPRRDGDDVLLYLDQLDQDASVPVRALYWFAPTPTPVCWTVRVPPQRLERWLATAVAADFPGGDKRTWRLATRYAQVRLRLEPLRLGVSPPVLGAVRFERSEA